MRLVGTGVKHFRFGVAAMFSFANYTPYKITM